MKLYKLRPMVVEAMEYTGENREEVAAWIGPSHQYQSLLTWVEPGDYIIRSGRHFYVEYAVDFNSTYEELLPAPPKRAHPEDEFEDHSYTFRNKEGKLCCSCGEVIRTPAEHTVCGRTLDGHLPLPPCDHERCI